MRRPITLRNHVPKNMYFPDTLRHLYGNATGTDRTDKHALRTNRPSFAAANQYEV